MYLPKSKYKGPFTATSGDKELLYKDTLKPFRGSYIVTYKNKYYEGKTPQEACEEAIGRIVNKPGKNYKDFQVGYIAVNKQGETGAYSIHEWFSYNVYRDKKNQNIKSDYFNKS